MNQQSIASSAGRTSLAQRLGATSVATTAFSRTASDAASKIPSDANEIKKRRIARDAEGWVTPRFERQATAALFDGMIDHKTGRRAA